VIATAAESALQPPGELEALERSLAFALELAVASESIVLGLDIEPIELPPAIGTELDAARLRGAGPLYLAAELESARLVPVAETLAALFASGAIQADLGDAAQHLINFWRGRRDRFTAEERAAFFARVFGRPSPQRLAVRDAFNAEFEGLMLELTEALLELERSGAIGLPQLSEHRLRASAARLAENLLARNRGIPEPAARELIGTINAALAILRVPAVQTALGARSVWTAVEQAARRYLGEDPHVSLHVERGRAGLDVLAWLARSAAGLEGTAMLAPPGPDVLAGAGAWLRATLALAENDRRA
jgi:hypothetical protein